MNYMMLISVVAFIALMMIVGVIVSKKINDADDFFLDGRNVPAFLIVATLLASEVGGGVMLGSVGLAYQFGFGACWYVMPVAVGLVLFGLFLAKKLKRDADQYGYVSMFDWLAGRYGNYKPLKAIGGFVMLVGFIGALASQFVAMGTALQSVMGADKTMAIILGGIAIVVYASMGGLLSVMWTDLLQAGVFVFGMVVLLPMLLAQPEVGGFAGLFANAPEHFFDVMNVQTPTWRITTLVTMTIAPFVRQYYYQRMFASKSEKIAQRSVFAQAILIVIVTIWTCLVGMCVFMINPALENPESAMPWVLSAVMHPAVAAIVMGAICATVMSTADTFLNAGSLTFVMDILKNVKTEEMSQEKSLKVARNSSFAIGAIALVIAVMSSSVVSALMNAWAILGGGLFVPMVVSYFYKPSTKEGVMAAMVAGLVTTLLFTIVIKGFAVPAIVCGLIAAFIALVVVSAMTKNKANA